MTNGDAPARSLKTRSRYIPAAVKRTVWARDDGRCAYVGKQGRCVERGFLEYHHVVPFAAGGPTTVENLQLRCRQHDAHEAEQDFGPLFVREAPVNDSVRTEFASNQRELFVTATSDGTPLAEAGAVTW